MAVDYELMRNDFRESLKNKDVILVHNRGKKWIIRKIDKHRAIKTFDDKYDAVQSAKDYWQKNNINSIGVYKENGTIEKIYHKGE